VKSNNHPSKRSRGEDGNEMILDDPKVVITPPVNFTKNFGKPSSSSFTPVADVTVGNNPAVESPLSPTTLSVSKNGQPNATPDPAGSTNNNNPEQIGNPDHLSNHVPNSPRGDTGRKSPLPEGDMNTN